MNYKDMNMVQRKKMEQLLDKSLAFEWNDNRLLSLSLGQFDLYSDYYSENDLQKELCEKINEIISLYNQRKTCTEDFLEIITNLIGQSEELSLPRIHSKEYYEYHTTLHKKILICGVGGIGKSHYIYELSQKLEETNSDYLCVYGKWTKTLDSELLDEVIQAAQKKEFLCIIDAFNEFSLEYHDTLLKFIKDFTNTSHGRLIVTFRQSSLPEQTVCSLESLLGRPYEFEGVSFSSAIHELLRIAPVNIMQFEELLETSNPLYIKMLSRILNSPKLVKATLNSICQLTFIMENYIDKSLGTDYWNDTKKVAQYMYSNNKKDVSNSELSSILGHRKSTFISMMLQSGFLSEYNYRGESFFTFSAEYLIDYLIARNLNSEINDLNNEEISTIIKTKISNGLYSLHEAFAMVIIDRFSKTPSKAIEIIRLSNLDKELDLSFFQKLQLCQHQIDEIQKCFEIESTLSAFEYIGGLSNKAFNCCNYCNNLFLNDPSIIIALNKKIGEYVLANYRIESRLNNLVYLSTLPQLTPESCKEYFWFAFWLMLSPNRIVRNLATKVVYELTNRFEYYINELITLYNIVEDFFIKEGIIHVLCSLSRTNKHLFEDFLLSVAHDKEEISALSLNRIAIYLYASLDYINWNKRNIYMETKNKRAGAMAIDILSAIDIRAKDSLSSLGRIWGKKELNIPLGKFILANKHSVANWNHEVQKMFSCVDGGECSGWDLTEELIIKHIPKPFTLREIAPTRLYICYQELLLNELDHYQIDFSKEEFFRSHHDYEKLEDTLLFKCAKTAESKLFGSLMCNYFTSSFASFNDSQNTIGYEVYNSMEYGDPINITSPVSLYSDAIDYMDSELFSRFDFSNIHDPSWISDIDNLKRNLLSLLSPIEYQQHMWRILSASIHQLVMKNSFDVDWGDTCLFWIAIDCKDSISGDPDDRLLTIENPSFQRNINDYISEPGYRCTSMTPFEMSPNSRTTPSPIYFPSAKIINALGLTFNVLTATWRNPKNEIIIFCNNNVSDHYGTPVSSTTYIREDAFQEIHNKHDIKFFAFTERFPLGRDCDLHFEISNDEIIKCFPNDYEYEVEKKFPEQCKLCKFGIKQELEKVRSIPIDIRKLLEERYGIDFEE